MINSKLIEYIESLTDEEFKEFGNYVNSPFFNTNKKLIISYGYFKKFFNNFEDGKFTKEGLYSAVYPDSIYRDSETRKLLSGLSKLLEGYFKQKAYDNDEFEKEINLTGVYLQKNMITPAEKSIKSIEEKLVSEKIGGQNYFQNLMKILIKKKSIELKKESFQTGNITEDKINNFLLNYFTSFSIKILQNIKAKQYYNLVSEETELSRFFELINIDKFIEWLWQNKGEYHETLIMNLCIIKCVNNGYDKDTYMKFKELLLKNHSLYSDFELNNLFTCLQGIQINRYRGNDPDALNEIFEVNNLILKYNAYAFYEGGSMPYSIFITMITIGIAYNKIKWVEDFIEKYTPLLNERHRQSLYNYAMAELSYAKGMTDESLKFSGKIEYEGFFMKHEVNILKLKIFYDENDFISMQYQLDTYKKLIEGNKYVGKLQYEIYSGFLKNYSELLRIKENNDKTAAGILYNKVKTAKNLIAKEWLELKSSELV